MGLDFCSQKRNSGRSRIFNILWICRIVIALCIITVLLSDFLYRPVQCLQKEPEKAIETYCYIHSTFTQNTSRKQHGFHFADDTFYPGVGPLKENEPPVWQKYYLWLPYLLLLNLIIFWLPSHYLTSLDDGYAKMLIVSGGNSQTLEQSTIYFVKSLNHHKLRAARFLLCEGLGIVSIVVNMLVTDWYLDGRFLHDIPKTLSSNVDVSGIDEAFDVIFPKVTKCTFYMFGMSGTIERKDLLCILTRNLLTGRIYSVLFVVFLLSLCIGGLSFISKIAAFVSQRMRVSMLQNVASTRGVSKEDIRCILKFCDVGDWLLLMHILHSMSNVGEWVTRTRKKLQDEKIFSTNHHEETTKRERQALRNNMF